MNMREADEQDAPKLPSRGVLIALGAGLAVLAVVAAVALMTLRGSGAATTVPRRTAPAPSATPTESTLPTIDSVPDRLQPLRTRVLLGVQSIGMDVSRGIDDAYARAKLADPKVAKWEKVKNSKGSVVAVAKIGRNGDPLSKMRAFAGLVNDAPRGSVNVAVMTLNYEDVSANTNVDQVFQSYFETMDSIERANPDITFLYATVPVTTANSWREVAKDEVSGLNDVEQPAWQDNIARERLNALIRAQYAATGRLFDIAALQARIDGSRVAAKTHENQWYYVMNPALAKDGKRLNTRGAAQLADTLMRLVAAAGRL